MMLLAVAMIDVSHQLPAKCLTTRNREQREYRAARKQSAAAAFAAYLLAGGKTTEQERTAARKAARVDRSGSIPVEVVEGTMSPRVTGGSHYYTTPGGKPVYHVNAYRKAWGKPVYHPSTRRVEVSALWLMALRGGGR